MPSSQLPALQIGLSHTDRQYAQDQAFGYGAGSKRRQVYLNLLAVRLVSHYLTSLGIDVQLPVEQTVEEQNIAAWIEGHNKLWIPNFGTVGCVPLLDQHSQCVISPSFDVQGWVVVQFDSERHYGTLQGFIAQAQLPLEDQENIVPLNALEDLQKLLLAIPEPEAAVADSPTLSHWLQGQVENGWYTLETLFHPEMLTLVPIRNATPHDGIERGKLILLEGQDEPFILVVGCDPINIQEHSILVELWATNADQLFPDDLSLLLLDEAEDVLMQAKARSSGRLKFTFTGEIGDSFRVQVRHHQAQIIEAFLV